MAPRIEIIATKKLVGNRMKMTLANNQTHQLWRLFMSRRKEVRNSVNNALFSMQIYNTATDFQNFNPRTEFEKWAAIAVSDFVAIPSDMETHLLEGGLYAVFIHKGLSSDFPKTAQYIFGQWLPQSEYELDQREHFELLGNKYKNNDPNSKEEVWIPIRKKE